MHQSNILLFFIHFSMGVEEDVGKKLLLQKTLFHHSPSLLRMSLEVHLRAFNVPLSPLEEHLSPHCRIESLEGLIITPFPLFLVLEERLETF